VIATLLDNTYQMSRCLFEKYHTFILMITANDGSGTSVNSISVANEFKDVHPEDITTHGI